MEQKMMRVVEQQKKFTALLKEMQEKMDSREGGRHERADNKRKRGSKSVFVIIDSHRYT